MIFLGTQIHIAPYFLSFETIKITFVQKKQQQKNWNKKIKWIICESEHFWSYISVLYLRFLKTWIFWQPPFSTNENTLFLFFFSIYLFFFCCSPYFVCKRCFRTLNFWDISHFTPSANGVMCTISVHCQWTSAFLTEINGCFLLCEKYFMFLNCFLIIFKNLCVFINNLVNLKCGGSKCA